MFYSSRTLCGGTNYDGLYRIMPKLWSHPNGRLVQRRLPSMAFVYNRLIFLCSTVWTVIYVKYTRFEFRNGVCHNLV